MNSSALVLKLIAAAIAATIAFHHGFEIRAAEGQRIVIEIHGLKFRLGSQVVRPGDVVVWKNMDIVPHTATAKDDSWDSGLIEPRGEWETVISAGMTQAYHCRFHPSMIAALNIETE